MLLYSTIINTYDNFTTLFNKKNITEKMSNRYEQLDKGINVSIGMITINLIVSIIYVWFCYTYIKIINPLISIEYQTTMLVLVYILLINYVLTILGDIMLISILSSI